MIRGTIIAVATTVAIAILKVFDIVYVMTGGNFETEVIANRMFSEMFVFRNFGRAGAIAMILFLARRPDHGHQHPEPAPPGDRGDDRRRAADRLARRVAGRPAVASGAGFFEPARASASPSSSSPSPGRSRPPGLLISSFRPTPTSGRAAGGTRCSTRSRRPQWTLANYETVLSADGMANAFINSLVVTIPAMVIPITIAAFAAYAFAWMRFPGRPILFAIVVGLLVVPLQMSLVPVLRLYAGARPERHVPRASGSRTPRSGCRWRSSCSTTTSASCRATCSSRPRSTARRTSRSSGGSCCRCPCRRSRRSRSSSSCGSGTTCSSRSCTSGRAMPWSDAAGAAERAGRDAGRVVAPADRRRVRDDGRAARRVPAAPAVLRARHHRGLRQGVSPRAASDDAILGRVMLAFEGETPPGLGRARLADGAGRGGHAVPAPQRPLARARSAS